jgi:hypothetical protein
MYKGIVQGGQVAWLAPDFPQGKAIWDEEIRPRFGGARDVDVNNHDRTVTLPNGGMLEMRSAENVDGMRGKGGKLDGVIVDEAAFIRDFFYAWRRVIRPMLVDRGGWALITSTTNIGSDFNQLMAEIEAGQRPDQERWAPFRGRSRDNKRLPPEEVEALYKEYPPGGSDMMQELEAELLDTHGALFRDEFWKYADQMNEHAMWIKGIRYAFLEKVIYVDLAASIKQTADYFAWMCAGLTGTLREGGRKAGILDLQYDHREGPDQVKDLVAAIQKWRPSRVVIEAVQYQLTMVQHVEAHNTIAGVSIEPFYPDTDKRSRAVPGAAAMARGDVWWQTGEAYLTDAKKQARKFPNGKKDSRYIEDHDDIVDLISLLGLDLYPGGAEQWRVRRVVR